MTKLYKILAIISVFTHLEVNAQIEAPSSPKIGDTLQEYIFTDLRNYKESEVKLSELRGKWLIMDFWSQNCSACLKSFPKMNDLHLKYQKDITVLMIGMTESRKKLSGVNQERESSTKQLFNRLQKLYNLQFTVAFDSVLASRYGVKGLPFILVVDPLGKVQLTTHSLSEQDITNLLATGGSQLNSLNGNESFFELQEDYQKKKNIDKFKNQKLFRSELSTTNEEDTSAIEAIDFANINMQTTKTALYDGVLAINRSTAKALFNVAYFGKTRIYPSNRKDHLKYSIDFVFETADSLKLLENIKYTYQSIIPTSRSNLDLFKKILQKDLEIYFGLKGKVEKRQMPVYFLKVIDQKKAAKLVTRGLTDRFTLDSTIPKAHQLVFNDVSMESFCYVISQLVIGRYPVINKTNFETNVDIDLRAYIYDLNEVQKAISQYGLKLERGMQEMEALVLQDSEMYK
ncbi:MAG: redoxin domain-containing protein [Crocinitomicaceae bacterium]|nr:redoxin domain-containing protein [Crocinitomicaceae bacterium]